MHELGILIRILRTVREEAEKNNVSHIHKISLEVGEVSGAIPRYLEMQFPIAAAQDPMFEGCELDIQVELAEGRCLQCQHVYLLKKNKGICPECGFDDFYTVSGTGLVIREIVVS